MSPGRQVEMAADSRLAVSTPGRLPHSFAGRLALIVAAGALVRILYTVLVAPWPPEVSDDQVFFHLQAQLIADGKGFIQPQLEAVGTIRPSAAHPPLYPIVLAGLAELGVTDQLAFRLTGPLFGSGTLLAIALIGRRLAGDRAGLIAAAIGAAYPILITADGALMSESLYGLFVASALIATYRLLDSPSPGRAITVGVLVGLAALTRGEALLLLFLLLIPYLRRPRMLRMSLVALLALVVVLTPWTIRNWSVFDRPVLISTNSGAVVGGANCESVYYGSNIGGWNILCDRPFPGRNEAEETNRQLHDGVRYARRNKRRLPVVAAARLGRGWSFFAPFQTNAGRSPAWQDAGVIMFWLMLPLAVYGAVLARRRRARLWPVLVPVAMVSTTVVVFYGFMRFRHSAEISIVVLAATALDGLIRGR